MGDSMSKQVWLITGAWGDRVRQLTHDRGVDRVVEVSGPGTINQSLRAVAPGGEIASIGFLSADSTAVGIDFFSLFGSGATFRHISVGSRQGLRDVAAAIAMAGLAPVIDRVFEFDQAQDAYAHLESGSRVGKVVIRCAKSVAGAR
jgi:NADPH:quinone reductase-like Zn-dependent oxidoreductase